MAAENNPYFIKPPNVYEALMAGYQGYDRSQKQMSEREAKAGRQAAMQALQSGDPNALKGALGQLISIGDTKGADAIATYAKNEAQQKYQQQSLAQTGDFQKAQIANMEAQRGLQQGQLGLQREQLGLQRETANTATIQKVKDADGNETLVRVDRAGNSMPIQTPGMGDANKTNPYAFGKMTDTQSKDALYASRMMNSEKVIRGVESAGTSWNDRLRGKLSEKAGFNIRSADYQKFDQAQRDFINATLRRESGAVINPSEFDNANIQYFPMPGDTEGVIKQKRKNRAEAIRGIASGAGQNYRPQNIFDTNENIINNPALNKNLTGNGNTITGVDYSQPTGPVPPKIGEVRSGYRYKGGNPSDPSSWVGVK